MSTEEVELGVEVQELAEAFALEDGKMFMPESDVAIWQKRLGALPPSMSQKIAAELLALAMKFARIGAGGADVAVVQLVGFAAIMLKDQQKAEALFAERGLPTKAAANVVGSNLAQGAGPSLGGLAPPTAKKPF